MSTILFVDIPELNVTVYLYPPPLISDLLTVTVSGDTVGRPFNAAAIDISNDSVLTSATINKQN